MIPAYVDTSALVAVAFDDPTAADTGKRLAQYSPLVSSNLLEAEMRAAFAREHREFDADLSTIEWIAPDRPLSAELARGLAAGYLRGADLWHIAVALYVAPMPAEIAFVRCDKRQRTVASSLGFQVGTE